MEDDNKFKFGVPVDISKGKNEKGEESMFFKGRASTGDKDSQGENLDVNGFDLSEFRTVNWNHSKNPDCHIGAPTKAVINKGSLDIEGELYSEMPQAIATHNLMKALQKRGKQLYLSVEGKVLQRGSNDKNNPAYHKILKSKITGVAITPNPINSSTFCELIQKGYTENNEWDFDDETVVLIKAAESEELEEKLDKSMTAEGGDNVTSKESVETAGNKKPLKSLEETQTKVFKKSDIFEKIYDQWPTITIEKAKSVYSLIEKTATMSTEKKEITDETISKAFEILDLASETISKGSAAPAADAKKDDDEDDDNEMVEKAKEKCTMMKSEGKDIASIKASLIKKGYSEDVVTKAMAEETITKSEVTDSLSKGEVTELIKSYTAGFEQKFDAVKTILTKQAEENSELKKSFETITLENEDLKKNLATISKQPGERKSVIMSKSYSDKFEKSENGTKAGQKFNLSNKADRHNLKLQIIEKSGVNQGENFDKNLTRIAQELELTGTLSKASDIHILQGQGFELVSE